MLAIEESLVAHVGQLYFNLFLPGSTEFVQEELLSVQGYIVQGGSFVEDDGRAETTNDKVLAL